MRPIKEIFKNRISEVKLSGKEITSERQTPDFIITADELIGNDITEIPMLVDPIFQKTGVVAFAGSSDTGKSSLLRQLSMNIVTGEKEFLGFKLNSAHQSVIYVSTEDDELELSTFLKKQNKDDLPTDKFTGLRFIFDTRNLIKKLTDELRGAPADCVIIDSFFDVLNNAYDKHFGSIRSFLSEYSQIVNNFKCLIIFLYHTNNNLLVSQDFEDRMITIVELKGDKYYDELRHLRIVKRKYIPIERKENSKELLFNISNLLMY